MMVIKQVSKRLKMLTVSLFLTFSLFSCPLPAMTNIEEVKSSNGSAWLMEDHSLPVITVRIDYENSGSAYDPEGREGLASFTTQMMDEGAGDMDSLVFNRALEASAIHFSAEAAEDSITISLQTMSEFREKAFALLATALAKPRFDREAVERIRANITSTLYQMEANPVYTVSLKWKEAAFGNHPYAHPKMGSVASVAAITREDLQQFHTGFLCHRRLVSITGDITAADVKTLLGQLPVAGCEATQERQPVHDNPVADGKAPVLVHKNVPQTVVYASIPALPRRSSDYYTMVVFNQMLGGSSLSSRLGREIRDKRGLAYYADSDINELDHAAWISFHFATRNEQANAALAVFQDVLATLGREGFTDSEVAEAKSYLTGSFPLNLDTQGALAGYLSQMQHYGLGIDYLEKRNGLIAAVTTEKVNSLTKALISDKHTPLIIMVGNPQGKEAK